MVSGSQDPSLTEKVLCRLHWRVVRPIFCHYGKTRRYAPFRFSHSSPLSFHDLSTPLRGMELVLRPRCRGWRRWVLGTGKGVDFRITDSTLHDTHLIFERQGEDWLVSCPPDCWGFFVNDEPVETAVVEHGDRLRVGRHELVFVGGELGVREQDERAVQPRWWRRLYGVS